ncbi:IucA/IucC family protein [Streptomyces djakartensis]|uniref:IucA/IucC family protein n=1 Tax=Streptomyces djakartensis TaxID=68193 RepID=UPI003F7D8891
MPALSPPPVVPRQRPGTQPARGAEGDTLGTDPLGDPDPHTVAETAAVENLLRCWARETGQSAPADGLLRVPLSSSGTSLLAPVRYWSPTGWHRFGPARLAGAPDHAPTADAVTIAALLARESTAGGLGPARMREQSHDADPGRVPEQGYGQGQRYGHDQAHGTNQRHGRSPGRDRGFEPRQGEAAADCPAADQHLHREPNVGLGRDGSGRTGHTRATSRAAPNPAGDIAATDGVGFVAGVADSVRRVAIFVRDRREHPADGPDLFLSAEQALLLGHPLHPAPKSREELTEAEARLYSPELHGSFPLHWMAVAPSLLATDTSWTERGRPVPATKLTARLAGPGLPPLDGYALLPLHPWQAREVHHRPDTAALLDSGLLRDLGAHGTSWHPTSSVRTVYRSDAPAMLKLSLGLRITNSRRENLRKELHRGVEVHRLLRTGLARQWQAVHPGFDIVRDPAWLAVDAPDGSPLRGLDVVIRHNPFTPSDDVSCVAGLVSMRPRLPVPPSLLPPSPVPPSPVSASPGSLPPGPGTHRPGSAEPLMQSRLARVVTHLARRTGRPRGAVAAEWLLRYLEHVVRPVLWLDGEAGVALEAHQQNTLLLLDTAGWPTGGRYRDNQGYYYRASRRADLDARLPGIGERSDTFVPDGIADERLAYYLAINNVLGLIGAFGSQRLADERLLLAAFRRFLQRVASGPDRLRSSLPTRLLDSPVLRCKANLLTRLHGMDELVGPVDTQSVYVTIANPLHC